MEEQDRTRGKTDRLVDSTDSRDGKDTLGLRNKRGWRDKGTEGAERRRDKESEKY